jgi:hypothetical protein
MSAISHHPVEHASPDSNKDLHVIVPQLKTTPSSLDSFLPSANTTAKLIAEQCDESRQRIRAYHAWAMGKGRTEPPTLTSEELHRWLVAVLNAFPTGRCVVSDPSGERWRQACTFSGGSRIDPGFDAICLRAATEAAILRLLVEALNMPMEGMPTDLEVLCTEDRISVSHNGQELPFRDGTEDVCRTAWRASKLLAADKSWGKYVYSLLCVFSYRGSPDLGEPLSFFL